IMQKPRDLTVVYQSYVMKSVKCPDNPCTNFTTVVIAERNSDEFESGPIVQLEQFRGQIGVWMATNAGGKIGDPYFLVSPDRVAPQWWWQNRYLITDVCSSACQMHSGIAAVSK